MQVAGEGLAAAYLPIVERRKECLTVSASVTSNFIVGRYG